MGSGRRIEGGDFVVVVVAGNLVGVMVVVARLLVVVVVVVVFRFWVVVANVDGPRFACRTAGEDVTTAEDAVVEFAVVDTEDVVDMIATGARLFSIFEREKHNEDGTRSARLLLVLLIVGDVCLCCRYGTRPISCDVFVPGRTNTATILERKRNVGRTK